MFNLLATLIVVMMAECVVEQALKVLRRQQKTYSGSKIAKADIFVPGKKWEPTMGFVGMAVT